MPPGEPVLANAEPAPWLKGRYQVVRLLGKGAQARVYVAYDVRLKLWRAVKVLAPAFVEDPDVRARFEKEAHAMARLAHPNLVRVVDVDTDRSVPFLVMELAHGGAITDWIRRHGPVPPILACRVVTQMCSGLAHAHDMGVVHRDVKPHNVLIRADGDVVLTDFGIAQVAEGMSLTATGTVMGSFAFMAPEQRTDAKSVDLRADIYAIGATLFTMLTAKTSAELFFAEAKDNILRDVPELLRPVILTACRYDRDERYASTQELREAIEHRVTRLPADPPVAPLNDHLIELPSDPAQIGSEGLEELRVQLGGPRSTPRPVDEPRMSRPITPFRPLPRPVVSTPLPSARRNPLPYRIASGTSAVRRDYADAGTPAPPRPIQIDIDGAKSLSAEYIPEPSPFLLGPSRPAVVLVLLLATMLSLMATGLANKVAARWRYEQASIDLMVAVQNGRVVLSDLERAGADTPALAAVAEALAHDAPAQQKAEAAAEFAHQVMREASRHPLPDLPRTHVNNLQKAVRRWEESVAHREEVRQSWLSRMTGELGL